METNRRTAFETVLAGCGVVALAIGAYLPWIRPDPGLAGRRDGVPDILLPKMNAGIEVYSLLVLVPAALVVATLLVARTERARRATLFLAGLVAVTVPAYYLWTTSLVGFDATFVPAIGWYVTIAAGALLTAAATL